MLTATTFIKYLPPLLLLSSSTSAAMPKFSANLIQLFSEKPFLERYKAAADVGFKCVETGFPNGIPLEKVVAAKNASGVEQVLLNIFTGDISKGEVGFAAIPGQEEQFKNSLNTTIEYGKALGVKKIHIMSGKINGKTTKEHDNVYIENLKYASKLLEKENILGVIEPISKYVLQNYYMNSYEKALNAVKAVNSPNLKIMFDVFHCQMIRGDITNAMDEIGAFIGHIQVAQAPNRNEITTPGELNFAYILSALELRGYKDWIGLEHKCPNGVSNAVEELRKAGYNI